MGVNPEQAGHRQRGSRSPESTLPQQARSRPHILDYDVLPHHGGSGISEQPQPQHLATYQCHGRQREAPLCWRCNPTLGFELLHGTMCSGLFLSQERRPWNEGWAQCPTRRSQMGPIQAIVPGKGRELLTPESPESQYKDQIGRGQNGALGSHTQACMDACSYTHTHTHRHIHAHAHTNTHMHAHAHSLSSHTHATLGPKRPETELQT